METKANYVLIGAFTLAVVAAAFGFVFWFQNLGAAAQRTPLRIVFEGAASGLRTGGNVNFNGIKIGEVTSIKLDDPKRVVVIAAVDKSAPIRKDSLVGLEFAGLTGVSSISLKGGSVEAGGLPVAEAGGGRAERRVTVTVTYRKQFFFFYFKCYNAHCIKACCVSASSILV